MTLNLTVTISLLKNMILFLVIVTLNLTSTTSLLKNVILFPIIVTFYLPTVTLFLVGLFNMSIYSIIYYIKQFLTQ